MTIPDEIRRSVVFVGYRLADGSQRLAGTGFFIGDGENSNSVRLVTARHVIEGIRNLGLEKVGIRANWVGGGHAWVDSDVLSWEFHPSDESVDIAMLAGFMGGFDHSVLPISRLATKEKLEEDDVGLGDEVFITGLFRHHHGSERNIPIVRVGNIAGFPEEKITTKDFGAIEAILIEARSLGGLSGSPVFLNLGPVRQIRGKLHYANDDKPHYLLGLIHGHFDSKASAVDTSDSSDTSGENERVNTGIALVVPFSKIADCFRLSIDRAAKTK